MERRQSTNLREYLEFLVGRAYIIRLGDYRYEKWDKVAEVDGIDIVARAENFSTEVRCAQYVFWYVMQEDWCRPRKNEHYDPFDDWDVKTYYLPSEFWQDTDSFLQSHGYGTVDADPQSNDIVLYYEEPNEYNHFGVYKGDGRVISRFGSGHVYEHGLWQIPSGYGSKAKFYRKSLPQEAN